MYQVRLTTLVTQRARSRRRIRRTVAVPVKGRGWVVSGQDVANPRPERGGAGMVAVRAQVGCQREPLGAATRSGPQSVSRRLCGARG
jgi:hypothetical protein